MASFSERYGYIKPSDVIIREEITQPIMNSILNWLIDKKDKMNTYYVKIEKYLWEYYFNRVNDDYVFFGMFKYNSIIIDTILSETKEWYEKIDLLENIIICFERILANNSEAYDRMIKKLNNEFERHNFAYRIIDGKIEEITSKEEIESIEEAISTSDNGVKTHLKAALEFISASNKEPDYRNSIKESISAVEAICRNLTGANDLGKALSQLEKKGISIQPLLKKGIENLYHFTNDKGTGIRHALIEDNYSPSSEEAIFMLVTCSAFINFLKKKNGN